MTDRPLVSILIPNYNYGKYLGTCLGSALEQTYENIDVVFVDNNSTDDSYDVALAFRSRYGDRLQVFRNDENLGGARNAARAYGHMDPRSQCVIYLSSDDYFHPTLVERSMAIMEAHKDVGFVMIHRNAVDEDGRVTEELPFYNANCVIPGTGQMEVFMMAGVGVSTQCFRNCHAETAGLIKGWFFDIAGDWFSNFCLACAGDMGYIKEPLCTYRTHPVNVTTGAIRNLTNSVEHVRLIQAFAEIATSLDRPTVAARLKPALEKLGTMCLRYCAQLLREGDARTAKRYLHLGPVLRPDLRDEPAWQALWRLVNLEGEERRLGLLAFDAAMPQTRRVSYDPPPGTILI